MKFKAICENHLYSKAYAKGKRAVTPALAVYVLPDYAAKRLAKAHPQHRIMNRIGLTTSTKLGGAVVGARQPPNIGAGLASLIKNKTQKTRVLQVIAARGAAVRLKSTDIERELDTAFTNLGMFQS